LTHTTRKRDKRGVNVGFPRLCACAREKGKTRGAIDEKRSHTGENQSKKKINKTGRFSLFSCAENDTWTCQLTRKGEKRKGRTSLRGGDGGKKRGSCPTSTARIEQEKTYTASFARGRVAKKKQKEGEPGGGSPQHPPGKESASRHPAALASSFQKERCFPIPTLQEVNKKRKKTVFG